ncbi:MAG: DUF4388 domain-containing protein [Verrucomicrobia bacterium]|nr:MAG: DUF4388 domain-containing protein [Verrucomicrobiota bacterium]
MGLPELIRFIDASEKAGQLEVRRTRDGAAAVLGFDRGQIVSAICGEARGGGQRDLAVRW